MGIQVASGEANFSRAGCQTTQTVGEKRLSKQAGLDTRQGVWVPSNTKEETTKICGHVITGGSLLFGIISEE